MSEETKKCPFCNELINTNAMVCPICGEDIQPIIQENDLNTKKCPYCGEEILSEAIKCKYCGEWFTDTKTNPVNDSKKANNKQITGNNSPIGNFERNSKYITKENYNEPTNATLYIIMGIVFIIIICLFLNTSSLSFLTFGCTNNGRDYIYYGNVIEEKYFCKNEYYDEINKRKGINEYYYDYQLIKRIKYEQFNSNLSFTNDGHFIWYEGNYNCRFTDYNPLADNHDFVCSESDFIKYYKKSVTYTNDMFDYITQYLSRHPNELHYIESKRWSIEHMPILKYRIRHLTKNDLDNYKGQESFDVITRKYPVTDYKEATEREKYYKMQRDARLLTIMESTKNSNKEYTVTQYHRNRGIKRIKSTASAKSEKQIYKKSSSNRYIPQDDTQNH